MLIYIGDITIECKGEMHVCPKCNGRGRQMHSAFDGIPVKQDLLQDEEFMDSYMNGGMDVICGECKGTNVIEKPIIPNEYKQQYEAHLQEMADCEYEQQCERRMGA